MRCKIAVSCLLWLSQAGATQFARPTVPTRSISTAFYTPGSQWASVMRDFMTSISGLTETHIGPFLTEIRSGYDPRSLDTQSPLIAASDALALTDTRDWQFKGLGLNDQIRAFNQAAEVLRNSLEEELGPALERSEAGGRLNPAEVNSMLDGLEGLGFFMSPRFRERALFAAYKGIEAWDALPADLPVVRERLNGMMRKFQIDAAALLAAASIVPTDPVQAFRAGNAAPPGLVLPQSQIAQESSGALFSSQPSLRLKPAEAAASLRQLNDLALGYARVPRGLFISPEEEGAVVEAVLKQLYGRVTPEQNRLALSDKVEIYEHQRVGDEEARWIAPAKFKVSAGHAVVRGLLERVMSLLNENLLPGEQVVLRDAELRLSENELPGGASPHIDHGYITGTLALEGPGTVRYEGGRVRPSGDAVLTKTYQEGDRVWYAGNVFYDGGTRTQAETGELIFVTNADRTRVTHVPGTVHQGPDYVRRRIVLIFHVIAASGNAPQRVAQASRAAPAPAAPRPSVWSWLFGR